MGSSPHTKLNIALLGVASTKLLQFSEFLTPSLLHLPHQRLVWDC